MEAALGLPACAGCPEGGLRSPQPAHASDRCEGISPRQDRRRSVHRPAVATRIMSPADTSRDEVILVDEHDAELGVAPKLEVHRDGRLHRAVSVVLFDDSGHVLLQRRASTKYHSAGLWSNTCCGHPL